MAGQESSGRQLSWSARVAQRLSPGRWKNWPRAMTLFVGFLALLWFLLRVIPKPSRAAYPCQRAAFPLASAFVLWVVGMLTMATGLRLGRLGVRRSQWRLAAACAVAVVVGAAIAEGTLPRLAMATFAPTAGPFVPVDAANTPVGTGIGIHPARVVWVHDPEATNWDPSLDASATERYWHDTHTDPALVKSMMGRGVVALTGAATPSAAWDALFHSFNQTHGRGNHGYRAGERIGIKVNHVEQRTHAGNSAGTADNGNLADLCPQMTLSLLNHLVNEAGVPEDMITVADPSRFIANKEYDPCHAAFPGVHWVESDFFAPSKQPGTLGREIATYSTTDTLHYSAANPVSGAAVADSKFPRCFYEATYLINLSVMKGHPQAGVTLTGKNWYGTLGTSPAVSHHDSGWMDLNPGYGSYRTMVDMMGHKQLGGKVMLNVLDALWGFDRHGTGSKPLKYQTAPFNNDYPSSMLLSQDAVAIDSVGVDFLRAEFAANMGGAALSGGIDDYLHEAAQANNPPSGTFYDPEDDGVRMASLGVHEHWNDPVERLYTANLNKGAGIELVKLSPTYVRPTGVLQISATAPNAPWTLVGPEGLSQSGTGPLTLSSVPTGRFEITWGSVDGWELPTGGPSMTVDLTTGGTASLQADYTANSSIGDLWLF